MIDFIRKYNCYQLGNSCKDQIGVKCFLILSSSSGQTKIILDVVNISFYGGSDFVSVIPFFCTTDSARIGTEILFRINIHHSATRRSCTWIITCTASSCGRMVYIYPEKDLRAYPGAIRGTEEWNNTYKIRTTVERDINHIKDNLCLAGRRTQNEKTLHADLVLAGITQLITVVLSDKINHHEFIRSLKPLIA